MTEENNVTGDSLTVNLAIFEESILVQAGYFGTVDIAVVRRRRRRAGNLVIQGIKAKISASVKLSRIELALGT